MPNSPYLDASVRWRIRTGRLELEEPGYEDRVAAILSAGLATEVVRPVSAGKEAEVLLCTYNGAPIAVKMYRLCRTSHKGDGPVKADAMGWRAADELEALRVDRTGTAPWVRLTEAGAMLEHGLNALGKYFHKYDLTIDAAPLIDRILSSLDRFHVLDAEASRRDPG